jgi:anti-sigma factor RsiW
MKNEPKRKLDCDEIFAMLSEYLDEELTPDMADCVSAHIHDCEPCVEFLESLRKSITICRQYQPLTTPSPLPENVRQQLRAAFQQMVARRKATSAD